jgi:hypothetical protein
VASLHHALVESGTHCELCTGGVRSFGLFDVRHGSRSDKKASIVGESSEGCFGLGGPERDLDTRKTGRHKGVAQRPDLDLCLDHRQGKEAVTRKLVLDFCQLLSTVAHRPEPPSGKTSYTYLAL